MHMKIFLKERSQNRNIWRCDLSEWFLHNITFGLAILWPLFQDDFSITKVLTLPEKVGPFTRVNPTKLLAIFMLWNLKVRHPGVCFNMFQPKLPFYCTWLVYSRICSHNLVVVNINTFRNRPFIWKEPLIMTYCMFGMLMLSFVMLRQKKLRPRHDFNSGL